VVRGPGADDNSSGATALLEAARVLRQHPMAATIELAFFTGEEGGLLGSREYVRLAIESGKHIVGALNNDMVGWTNDHRLDNTIRYSNPGIRDIQHAAAIQFSDLITYDALYYKSTDAAAFFDAWGDIVGGIGSYPVPGNPHYHRSTDLIETINHVQVAATAKTTIATLMLLASSPSRVGGIKVEAKTATVDIVWTPSPEKGVVKYEIVYGPTSNPTKYRVESAEPRINLRRPPAHVAVRAIDEHGRHGWDWGRYERK